MKGVIAAIATPVTVDGEPDAARFLRHAKTLLEEGCDGLNVLGTTGEATSFSLRSRRVFMAAAASAIPRERLMVGTGAAAVADAIELTRAAGDEGFSAALLLPPFYYKGVTDDGLFGFVAKVIEATGPRDLPIYLYNFPQMTGIVWSITLLRRLLSEIGGRIAGLKDSSGDLAYARAAASIAPSFAVFPSNEGTLMEAREGTFAGCISATANLNAAFCARAFRKGDAEALEKARQVRSLFQDRPLIPGIKAVLARRYADPEWLRVMPPLQEAHEEAFRDVPV
jgi:4-hydroxy-tetrahydrodipicolinate synthase